MLTSFKKAQIRAEILETVAGSVNDLEKSYRDWTYDDAVEKVKNFEAEKNDDPNLELTWEIRNAYSEIEEGEYRLEVYSWIIKALEKLL